MNILIIGATRGIGRQVLGQALEQGHRVTGMARNLEKLDLQHELLTSLRGDIGNLGALFPAVRGQEAVIITVGIAPTLSQVRAFSEGTRNVLEAMAAHGVKRLLAVTGIGAGDSRGHGGFLYDRIINPLLLGRIYADKDRQEDIVKQSGATWTIVRPGFLTDGPLTGTYRVLTDLTGVTCGKISRADVAHFLLQEVTDNRYVGQTPLLTY